jgi:CubicO group peptidase (beta-lactamase class C family)
MGGWRAVGLAMGGACTLGFGCVGPELGIAPLASIAGPLDPERAHRFEAATRYSDQEAGRAVLALEGDRVIWEEYRGGLRADEPWQIYSGTKSFLCAAAMLAEEEGALDLDRPAARWITEWRDDPAKSTITGRQLLQQTSGLQTVFPDMAVDVMWPFPQVADKQAWAVDQPIVSPPGERFEYGCVHMLAFAQLFERAVGEDALSYLERWVFEPIGLEHGRWRRDPDGNPMFSLGASLTARDWLRFGALLRDDGVWEGEQVLPPGTLEVCAQGSEANPAYGLALWLNRPADPELVERLPGTFAAFSPEGALLPGGPEDLMAALGWHNNRMYVIPSLDLVILRYGRWQAEYYDGEFLSLALGEG